VSDLQACFAIPPQGLPIAHALEPLYVTTTGGDVMLRMSIAAALVVLSTSAFAQSMEAVKGIKFGVGCIGPVATFAARLGTCAIDGAKSRIWCPNGKIFDRAGAEPQSSYVVRAICDLNQIL
jgi:hypothetical protein